MRNILPDLKPYNTPEYWREFHAWKREQEIKEAARQCALAYIRMFVPNYKRGLK
jgi:hypothetical protein